MDGALLPVDAADRRRARQARSRLCGHGAEVRDPFRVDLDRDEPAGCRHRELGRAGRVLLRRDADARRASDPAQGPLARRSAAAVRRDRVRRRAAGSLPDADGARPGVHSRLLRRVAVAGAPARSQPGGPADHVARRRATAATDPRDHARRGRIPRPARDPRDLAPPSRTAVHLRLGRAGVQRPLPPGRVRHRYVRRQLKLARPGLVPDERRHPTRTSLSCTATTATGSKSSAPPAPDRR